MKGKTRSEETKIKMSELMKGNTYAKGKPKSEETKRKISESMKRKPQTVPSSEEASTTFIQNLLIHQKPNTSKEEKQQEHTNF